MAGRNPTPTALKIITGKKGRGINKEEPRYDPVIPECPMELDDVGKKEWESTSKLLFDAGVLTEADKRTLAIYCHIWSQIVSLAAKLKSPNDYVAYDIKINTDTGDEVMVNPKTNPLCVRLETLYSEHRAYSAVLGLDPVNRGKVKATPTPKKETEGTGRFFK